MGAPMVLPMTWPPATTLLLPTTPPGPQETADREMVVVVPDVADRFLILILSAPPLLLPEQDAAHSPSCTVYGNWTHPPPVSSQGTACTCVPLVPISQIYGSLQTQKKTHKTNYTNHKKRVWSLRDTFLLP